MIIDDLIDAAGFLVNVVMTLFDWIVYAYDKVTRRNKRPLPAFSQHKKQKQVRQAVIVLLALGVVTGVSAQTKSEKQVTAAKKPAAASTENAEADLELNERRSKARALLISLSSDARTFNDQTLRARSLARIADALWQVDAEQARLMFRKAWEAAEVADKESDRKLQEEINQQKTRTGGSYAINLPANVRREVLRLAARRDRPLGEELLEKLKAQKLESAASVSTPGPYQLSDDQQQRLSVANELLRSGEVERAVQFADPVLAMVSVQSIDFLSNLRAKDSATADKRYAALLGISATNPQSDANTVSLLSSYIFTPGLFIIFSGNGTSTSQMSSTITPAAVSAELRNAFFHSASAILLRPLPEAGQDPGPLGLDGRYLMTKRLLPFFEQSAPSQMADSLRAHLNALGALATETARKRDDEWMSKGVKPDKRIEEREQSLLERIERAKTSAERDSLHIQLAMTLAGKGDMRARDFASKVENSEERKQVQPYIDASLALYSVQKKLTDQALELVHKGELPHLLKVWVLTETARLVVKTDPQKAIELVDQAGTDARRIDVSDANLPRALVAVANALKVVDAGRVWDATFDAVKAANSAEGFSGEDGELVMKFQSKSQSSIYTNDVANFDLEGIFSELAMQDYDRAVELARGFQGEGPRAVATIAIARAVLEPKKK